MKVSSSQNPTTPPLFASVRGSRDLSLAAFAIALLTAFALHAGAFLPRLSPGAAQGTPTIQQAAPGSSSVVASQPVPPKTPRG